MKRKITQAEYDALSDALKAVYKQDGTNWLLQIEGDATFDSLKAEKAAEKLRREKAEADLKVITDKAAEDAAAAATAAEDAARTAGDVTALEASWQAKFDKQKVDHDAALATSQTALNNTFVTNVALTIANAISTVPDLMLDMITKRLSVEVTNGIPITRVVDAAGRPSALSIAELQKEFVDNPAYKAIIKASDASGGGAGGGAGNGGAGAVELSKMNATEEAAYANANPEEYARLTAPI